MKNIFRHFLVVCTHRWYVFLNCCKLGIPFRGLVHDLSKFSFQEFFRSAKYFSGNCSPIIKERRDNYLYSKIFIHHTRRNKHHYEYHIDEYRGDIVLSKIPHKILLEYVADTISASKTYNKHNYTTDMPFKYFSKVSERMFMHSMSIEFVKKLLDEFSKNGFKNLKFKMTKTLYETLSKEYSDTEMIELYSLNNKLNRIRIDQGIVEEKMR